MKRVEPFSWSVPAAFALVSLIMRDGRVKGTKTMRRELRGNF